MTKFLDKSFSSRPSSREYRDNYDRTFKKNLMSEFDEPAADDGDTPAPEGQIWVCGACGRTSKTRYGFSDSSCMSNAVLCYENKMGRNKWIAVAQLSDITLTYDVAPAPEVAVIESTTAVQFNKPEHEAGCNCRLCRTARRAEGK